MNCLIFLSILIDSCLSSFSSSVLIVDDDDEDDDDDGEFFRSMSMANEQPDAFTLSSCREIERFELILFDENNSS